MTLLLLSSAFAGSPIQAQAPVSSRLSSASEAPLSSVPGRQAAPSLPPPSPDANKVARSNAAEARAARSGSGVQAQAFPAGIDQLTGAFEHTSYDFAKAEVGAPYDCWDYLGVRDFNLTIPLDTLDVTTTGGGVTVRVTFDEIRGEDMEIYAVDSEYTDSCVEFEAFVYYVSLQDAVVEATIAPHVQGGQLTFTVEGTPTVSGDLDTDINNVPDDLILYFIEETLFETVSETMGEMLPEILDEAVAGPLMEGEFEDFDYSVRVTDASTSAQGLLVGADATVGWSGDDGCPGGTADPQGRSPDIDFGDGDGAAFAVGLTEAQVDDAFRHLWEDGYFCFTRANVQEFIENITSLFDPSIAGLGATVSLDSPPSVKIDAAGMHATLDGFHLTVTGDLDGETVKVLVAEGKITAIAQIALDQDLASFTMSLVDLQLQLDRFDVDHLVADNPDAEDHMRDFLEGWVADWAKNSAQGVPLYASTLNVAGWYIKVDRVKTVDGAVELFMKLYVPGDPAIDSSPPDTNVQAAAVGEDGVRLTFEGTDDREAALAYAYDLDGEGWSSWTNETQVDVTGLSAGRHVVTAKARDAWWNEDATPAEISFDLESLPEAKGEDDAACGCASGADGATAALAVAGLALLARRRSTPRA